MIPALLRRMRAPALAVAFSALAATPSCSVLLDTNGDQCATDGDCVAKGAGFENTMCGPQRTCVCANNKACIDRLGVPAVCRKDDRVCAPLLSQDCTRIHAEPGDLEKDAVILGILLPLTGSDASSGLPDENAAELARREINLAAAGLPPLTAGAQPRPLVFLSCTDADDPVRAARHLAEDVRVPAIIGPAFSGVTTTVAREVTIPDKVLIISPSATSPTLTDLADEGLVWRTCPSDVFQSVTMSGVIANFVEPEIRTSLMLQKTDKIRLAVVNKGDAYGSGLAAAIFKSVTFNGTSAAMNGDQYLQIDYGDADKLSPDDLQKKLAAAVDQIVAFKPHILVTIGTNEAIPGFFTPLEKKWTETSFRPRHVVSDGLQVSEMITAVGTNDELRHRVFGTIAGTQGGNFDLFRNAYNVAFKDGTTPDSYAASAYDAAYLLAYAISSIPKDPITGQGINAGLQKTIPSSKAVPINAGGSEVNKGYKAMLLGGIDYNGASGPLDFDPTTGEAPGDIQVWCVDAKGGTATGFKNSGLFFDARTKTLQGTPSCP